MIRFSLRLTARLTLIAALATVPALAIIVHDQANERRAARERAVEDALRLAHLAADQQALIVDSVKQQLTTLALFRDLREGDRPGCQRLLQTMLREHPSYMNLWVVNADGSPFCAATVPRLTPGAPAYSASGLSWFTRAMHSHATAIGDYQLSLVNGRPTLVLAQPIAGASGAIERVVAASIGLDQLNATFSKAKLPAGATLTLTDSRGTILARMPDAASWIGRRHTQFPTTQTAGSRPDRKMFESAGTDGVRRLYAVLPVSAGLDTGLFVTLDIESSAVLAEANQLLRQHLLLLGVLMLGAFCVTAVGGRLFLHRPVDAMRAVTRRIAGGDFNARAQLATSVPGLGDLGEAINAMAGALEVRQGERDQAEHALSAAEERMRFALEVSHVGVWEHNGVNDRVFWSDTVARHHGISPGTFGGRVEDFLERVHPDERASLGAAIANAITTRQHELRIEYRAVWPDGTERRLATTAHYTFNEAGELIRGAGVTIDITEQRSLEEQLRQAHKMDAIGQLAGGVAHDFNNMLTAILGNADFLLEDLVPGDRRRQEVEEIKQAGQRAAALTQQLLAFSRKQRLAPRVLRLGDVASGVAPMLRRLLGETIELSTVMDDRSNVKADAGQIEQVLMNLAVNARDAMKNGGRLTIETRDVVLDHTYAHQHTGVRPGAYVMVAVSDTGEGMDAATQRRIFEPFFTTKATGQGTGLGLATVYGIVTQSGGHIWVYSEPGHGTSFKVYLPRTDELAAIRSADPTDAPRGTETILVVEDEDVVRDLITKALARQGYRVYAVNTAARAITFATKNHAAIDLIVTDVVLPDMSGPDMIDELKRRRADSPVVYMSGYTDGAVVHHGVLTPDARFLQKPFTSDTLARICRDALDEISVPVAVS
jgi:two-component system cell cycle sensor histidine kinase/response regulator CckA